MDSLRHLPSVDQVLRALPDKHELPHEVVVAEIRAILAEKRAGNGPGGDIENLVEARLSSLTTPSLRQVINATGVVLHTNLGRAPLAEFELLRGYTNLEYDLAAGRRGKRDDHTAHLLERLIGKPAILVNNNAAAVFLVLHELAAGHEVIVSRGELIEIGDGFRIPEIMARSGAVLREVGTTNRTTVEDYRSAINERTRLIMRVHPSNFHISGFTARPALKDLTQLGVPVYEDLGSGCLADLRAHGIQEPLVSDSVAAGVHMLSFSCDKLLGGPQTGIIAGHPDLVARVRRNFMYRALRVDKVVIQALQATLLPLLRQDWQAVPALRMIFASPAELKARAEKVRAALPLPARIREGESPIGGGSTPDQLLATWLVEIDAPDETALERNLRSATPPVVARIDSGKVVLDMRTVGDAEIPALVASVSSAASR